MGGLGRQGPEIPLHVVVPHPIVGAPLLGVDEILKLLRVADEEDRRVVSDQVVVAVVAVELDGEATRVAHGVGRSHLAGNGGEAEKDVGSSPLLEDAGLGVVTHVLVALEVPVGTGALGMDDPFGDAFPVELGHLLDQVVVLEQDGSLLACGEGVLVRRCGDSCIGCGVASFGHCRAPLESLTGPRLGRGRVRPSPGRFRR